MGMWVNNPQSQQAQKGGEAFLSLLAFDFPTFLLEYPAPVERAEAQHLGSAGGDDGSSSRRSKEARTRNG